MKRLEMISRSIKRAEESTFIIAEGGKKNTYIVVNQETNKGYTIKVKGKRIVSCNCKHYEYRKLPCKHMFYLLSKTNLDL